MILAAHQVQQLLRATPKDKREALGMLLQSHEHMRATLDELTGKASDVAGAFYGQATTVQQQRSMTDLRQVLAAYQDEKRRAG